MLCINVMCKQKGKQVKTSWHVTSSTTSMVSVSL